MRFCRGGSSAAFFNIFVDTRHRTPAAAPTNVFPRQIEGKLATTLAGDLSFYLRLVYMINDLRYNESTDNDQLFD